MTLDGGLAAFHMQREIAELRKAKATLLAKLDDYIGVLVQEGYDEIAEDLQNIYKEAAK